MKLRRARPDTVSRDAVTKNLNVRYCKDTLLNTEHQVELKKASEEHMQMTTVLYWCVTGDKEIIDIGLNKMESAYDVIH